MTDNSAENLSLYAVYYRGASASVLDVAHFILLAEIERLRRNLRSIHAIVLDGERSSDDRAAEASSDGWRSRHIVLPLCRLIPACTGVSVVATLRELTSILDGRDAAFPIGYSSDRPSARHQGADLAAAIAQTGKMPTFVPQGQAEGYARQWISEYAAGRKVVTLALGRLETCWLEFLAALDRSVYCPVLLCELGQVLSNMALLPAGVTSCPVASANLEIAAALVQESYLNLSAGSELAALSAYNVLARSLIFQPRNSTADDPDFVDFGVARGSPHPFATRFQRMVWGAETSSEILQAFDDMVAVIEEGTVRVAGQSAPISASDGADVAAGAPL